MKKKTLLKKLVSSIMVAIIVLGQFSSYKFVSKAATITTEDGPLYLSLSAVNENGIGYSMKNTQFSQDNIIWSIMSTKENSLVWASNLYCIKAEYGETWEETGLPSDEVRYNKSYSVPLTQETELETANTVLLGEYKNEILWIIDNMYVIGESDKIEFLEKADIHYDATRNEYTYYKLNNDYLYNQISGTTNPYSYTLTEDDIIAIQQAALWYFTNNEEESFDVKGIASWLRYTIDGNTYNDFNSNVVEEAARNVHSYVLYNYLIDEATKVAAEYGETEYKLKNSTAKLWISLSDDGTVNNEQPIIEVHKIPKYFDLSLRKTIVEVKDNEENVKNIVNTSGENAVRNVEIDEATLNDGSEETTTAKYKHRKDPVVVETGDTVKYVITIYNEGDYDGYATIIKDKLPGTWNTGLRLQNNQSTVTSTTGNIYNVGYETETNTVILTMAENSPKNVLRAYDGEGNLEAETVYIECEVMGNPDNENSKILTNIAYIAQDYNAESNTLEDRDSLPSDYPQENTLITDDIGYTGNTNNPTNSESLKSNESYYEGEEDDDDFEKVIILPETFDLSLRKNITKVNDEEVTNDRTPNVIEDNLYTTDTTKTTAEYKHRKDPVVVTDGDIVEYNISIYNEGSIDGVASIIKDQLPAGLTFSLEQFIKNGDEYFVTSTTGNIYKVTYDEQANLVTFDLVETQIANIKLLEAYQNGEELEPEVITLKCTVNVKADNDQNTYLTNIAYIYEAIRYDGTANGTIVTNEICGEEDGIENDSIADRDSEPYNYPSETADELKTIGNIGYTGNTNNPTNLETLANSESYYEGEQDDDDFEKLVILPKTFDLSLRKYITKVDGEALLEEDSREPNVITKNSLDAGLTTAEYKHRKDPVIVEDGSNVTYNITIYNEGSIDGVATTIRDQLPTGLKLNLNAFDKEGEKYYVESTKGNIYEVTYIESSNLVQFTLDNAKTETITYLEAYEENDNLNSETIELECEVNYTADNDENTYLTNIAYIYTQEQIDGTVITNQEPASGIDSDRDSTPYTHPGEIADELTTVGDLGYTGKDKLTDISNPDTYYKGEQDDDDFEKLVMLPKTFDLSLRKYITKVDGEALLEEDSREPEIITENSLDNGTSTTAEYKHRKDAVIVEDGSKVTYNITIYNESSIDGLATIIRDQLPIGLKLNLNAFDKEGEKYYVESTTGNTYEVTYIESSNLVQFTLDKTKTVKYLTAYKENRKLDSETIQLECEVNYTADNDENTYLTNIAYIYTQEQIDGTVITNQEPASGIDSDRDSTPYTHPGEIADELTTVGDLGYTGKDKLTDISNPDTYYKGEQDDDDFEKLVMLPKEFDLKLIKYISAVNNEETENRILSVDTSKLNTTDEETTADYILEKSPVPVKAGDFVTYTFRVYNEGNYDGYATKISENIPEGLEFIVVTDGAIFSWDGVEQKDITKEIQALEMYSKIVAINSNWGYTLESSIITTNALSEDLIQGFGQSGVEYADGENKIDYEEISVIFRVKQDVQANVTIRNEAAISEDKAVDNNGEEVDVSDRDSTPDEWKKEDSEDSYDEEGKWPIYEEDDEDYDNIITKSFDLSLRKQIIQINNSLYTNRFSKLDTANAYENTLYDYYNVYGSIPTVKAGDTVVYSIKVYNEGEIDGYASLIVDELPSGLEFVEYEAGDGSINDRYGWTLVEGTTNLYQTDYLSYEKDANRGTSESTILKAYDGEGEASYQEVYIECKVKEDVTKDDSLLNVAQIAEDSDENGKAINDKDSIPGTSDDKNNWKEEDDLDIEILQLKEFDLALRKFITQIENGEDVEEVTTRIPQVSYDEETKKIVYTHPKDALVVHVGDTVIYTLRVYNEGEIDGYAAEIKDDIPEYLEYLPKHETNIENEWIMYDKDGNETKNVEDAVCIKTEHLAKGHGLEEEDSEGSNLIEAFEPDSEISEENPDYKEVQVAFKVKDPNSTEYEIVNFAQISEDTDSEGDPIKDVDSEPDNGEGDPKEDDEDIEKVKVEYFDLSLLKYVTKVIVNENGVERINETGNVGDENDIIPHVQINKKNIHNTVVKFVYTIEITNEGQIAGEATEITDYVPKGLVFVAEDNEFWIDEGNNVISTKQLTGTTLQPGESAQVEVVLRWINGSDNLGPKTNVAEISEDYNEEHVPDKDSTPDNKIEGEDDIDDATVLLSVNQGGGIQSIYINISIIFLVIILVGTILIKKFVL